MDNIITGLTPQQEMELHSKVLNLQPRPTPKIELVPEKGEIEVSLKKWKMKQYRKWIELAKEVRFEDMYPMMVEVVRKWDCHNDENELIPITIEGFDELSPLQFKKVLEAVSKATSDAFLS